MGILLRVQINFLSFFFLLKNFSLSESIALARQHSLNTNEHILMNIPQHCTQIGGKLAVFNN